jgi:acyl-coenzyme A synthetase/AMP-(fatty) acid ligase
MLAAAATEQGIRLGQAERGGRTRTNSLHNPEAASPLTSTPARVEIVDAIPKTAAGKVLRRELRDG